MTTAYCTTADIEDVLSRVGVELSVDDYPPTDLGNAIVKASNKIDFNLRRRYTEASLAQSTIVTDWAAIIACHYLRRRRGNPSPPGIAEMYAEAMAEIEEVKLGRAELPGVGVKKSYAPGMSVMVPRMRPFPHAAVEKSRGTTAGGTPAGYVQHVDPYDRAGANAYLDYVI